MKRQGNETENGRIKFKGRYPPGFYMSPEQHFKILYLSELQKAKEGRAHVFPSEHAEERSRFKPSMEIPT